MNALLLAPSHDRATSISRGWGEQLLLSCADLVNDVQPCTRQNIDSLLNKDQDLLYIGHGTASRLLIPGNQSNTLIDAKNVDSSRTVIAIACKSAQKLGNRAKVDYLGWKKNLIFPTNNAAPLGGAAVESVTEFLAGGTFEQLRPSFIRTLTAARHDYEAQPDMLIPGISSRLGAMCAICWMANLVARKR